MIQETYDCLLTRAYFINNTEDELLDSIESKNDFICLVQKVSTLMQQEDFFLLKQEYQHTLSLILRDNRFKYGDESIIEDINYIILRLNQYKSMSEERKKYLIDKFYQDQFAIRNVPMPYRVKSNIDNFMVLDFYTLTQLFPHINGDVDESEQYDLEIFNDVEYISLMNIFLNKHPEVFFLDDFSEITLKNLKEISTQTRSIYTLMYIKKTIRNIKKLKKGKYKVVTI